MSLLFILDLISFMLIGLITSAKAVLPDNREHIKDYTPEVGGFILVFLGWVLIIGLLCLAILDIGGLHFVYYGPIGYLIVRFFRLTPIIKFLGRL